jgi:hypothetical protein
MGLSLSGRTIYKIKNGSIPTKIPSPTTKDLLSGLMLVSWATSFMLKLILGVITLSGADAQLLATLVG